jgi:hypothetical protein
MSARQFKSILNQNLIPWSFRASSLLYDLGAKNIHAKGKLPEACFIVILE